MASYALFLPPSICQNGVGCGAWLRRLVRDRRLGPLHVGLAGLDLELRLLRLVVAEIRELLVELGLSLALLDL